MKNIPRTDRGFTILQLLVTLVVMAVVSSFAIMSIRSSRSALALQNSVRFLASNMEKARLDAVRRHSSTAVTFTSDTSYTITMDFGGSGTPFSRSFNLENGVRIISTPLPSATFNWRGRTLACTLTFALQNQNGDQSWVDVSDAGDVTVNSDVDVLPNANFTAVNGSADVYNTAVVTGTTVRNNTADCSEGPSGSVGPPITGTGPGGCTASTDPSSVSIRKNGASSAPIVVSSSTAATISVTSPTNLLVSPTSAVVTAGGNGTFTVSSRNNTRGTFAVNFSTPCTTVTSLVKVTN
jgi:type II secretory pathway pseudopilin PulG